MQLYRQNRCSFSEKQRKPDGSLNSAQWIYGRLVGGELRVVDLQSFSDTKRVGGFDFI